MPVGSQFIDIIIRRDSIASKFPGGWDGFLGSEVHIEPIGWYDDYLYRTGVMYPPDAQTVIDQLEAAGLTGLTLSQNNEKIWVDFCLLPELSGGETKCYWLDPNFKSGSRFLGDESTLVLYGPNEKPIDAGV